MGNNTGDTIKSRVPRAMPDSWTERYHQMYPQLDIEIFTTIYSLRQATQKIDKIFSAWLALSNVTASKMYILMLLWAEDDRPVSFKSLGEAMSIGKASVSGMITALVDDGWVERREDPQDRRNLLAALTSAGRERLKGVLEEHARRLQQAFGDWSQDDLNALQGLLKRFADGAASVEY